MLKNIADSLIRSSADPKRYSLAAKGIVLLAGSQVVKTVDFVCSVGLTCIGIDTGLVAEIARQVELIVYGALLVTGAGMALFGLARKAYYGHWSAPVEN